MPRRRFRQPGDLTQLRRVLWRTIVEVEALLDTHPPSNALVLKSTHALSQLAGTYTKLVESSELEARVAALEATLNTRKTP
jgi:hypothetical protein